MTDKDPYADIEIIDTDNIQFGQQEKEFNHQSLVMLAYQKSIDALMKEMIEGFWQEKRDKLGNQLYVYNPDTRKSAIESIKTLKNLMIADITGTPQKKIVDNLITEDKTLYETHLKEQNSWINKLPRAAKTALVVKYNLFSSLDLNEKLPFYHYYINSSVEIYRKLFEALENCLAEKKYFKRKKIIA